MKRSSITRRTPLAASAVPLRRTRIAPVSARRAREVRAYSVLRRDFLAERPWCEFPGGCGARAVVVHHTRGRTGARLLDVAWWKASCDAHNEFAETRTGEALAVGWLVRIEGVAS